MTSYFEDKLLGLLPPVYRERDMSGDLRAFLRVPAASLDEIKGLIDHLPDIFNIDICDVRFIPLLAASVGYEFDATRDPDTQRREIRGIIESYRRKGSIPAIRRELVNIGWQGEIEETFHRALRLNARSLVNQAKLPGRIHSLGVYQVESRNESQNLRDALRLHHPAGVKVYFLQWLYSIESMGDDLIPDICRIVHLYMTGYIHDVFVVGHRRLNSDYRLTKRQTTGSFLQITNQTTLLQDIERAGVRIIRWHGRTPSAKLNALALNTRRLLNAELSERRLDFVCEINTELPKSPKPVTLRLATQHLNRSRLTHSACSCRILFRQENIKASCQAGFESVANLYAVTQWPNR